MSSGSSFDDLSGGDLGLGDGLKPGVLLIPPAPNPESNHADNVNVRKNQAATPKTLPIVESESTNGSSGFTTPEDSDDEYEISLMPIQSIQDLKSQFSNLKTKSSRSVETNPNNKTKIPKEDAHVYDSRYFPCDTCGAKSDKSKCKCEKIDHGTEPSFPVYANIQYGTSIRQQKELYKHNIEELQKKMGSLQNQISNSSNESFSSKDSKLSEKSATEEEIAMKLAKTLQEVEDLKQDLETCEKRLDSKYEAISILKKQAEVAHVQMKLKENYSKETTLKLSQEINKLQNDLDFQETTLLNSEQMWAERYDRVCKDNSALMGTLEARTEELRKITAQKMAVERENDELLALLDVQERAKYERTRSVSSEENYCNFTTTELAVLGACRCRITEPDPCGCAHAAANLKKELSRMKEERADSENQREDLETKEGAKLERKILLFKNRRDEAYLTVEAYRKAFEEQLQRNKILTIQLANIGSSPNAKSTKSKSAFRWLVASLTDDEISENSEASVASPGSTMSDQEMILYLTDLLHEKKEVLAHQKLAGQILGDQVKTLEAKLAQYEIGDREVFH